MVQYSSQSHSKNTVSKSIKALSLFNSERKVIKQGLEEERMSVKLGIVKDKGFIYRRVKVHKDLLVDDLKKYAVCLFDDTANQSDIDIDNYIIEFTYKDQDGDTVRIFTTREIEEACDENAVWSKRILKIFAEVKKREGVQVRVPATVVK